MGQQASQQAGQPAEDAGGYGRGPGMGQTREPTNEVQFVASALGGVPGATAYHSSVVVNGTEYSFSDGGIFTCQGLESHKQMSQQQQQKSGQALAAPEVIDMGLSHYTGSQMKAALERHFLPGTYDFLRKNCNSFADCAIYYLLQKRIDGKYRRLEQIGAKNPSMIGAVSGGQYAPNPKAEGFDCDKLCDELNPDKKWNMPGQATGGQTANSAEAMRAARLARLGGGGAAPAPAAPPAEGATTAGAGSGG